MRVRTLFLNVLFVMSALLLAPRTFALDNDRLLNRQFFDDKRFHWGFSIGTHIQDFIFTHNGYITDNGEEWFMQVPDINMGFNVSLLGDMRLAKHFNLRLAPGMYFGSKAVRFHELNSNKYETQDVKSALITIPLELKASALRYGNIRPYVIGGVMATFDVTKKRSDFLRFKTTDFMLEIGFGMDIYLPFFKLIPELKFCFGLTDALQHNRPDLNNDPSMTKYTQSIRKVRQQMFVLSFYFE